MREHEASRLGYMDLFVSDETDVDKCALHADCKGEARRDCAEGQQLSSQKEGRGVKAAREKLEKRNSDKLQELSPLQLQQSRIG